MQKQTAIDLFGSPKKMAEALGVTVNAVYMMPPKLNQRASDQVNGAAIRLGVIKPTKWIRE